MRRCKWFGHKIAFGYNHYFKITGACEDGIGTEHIYLADECVRCGDQVTVGAAHAMPDADVRKLKARLQEGRDGER